MKFSSAQQKAIETVGSSLLVSAAAGSGKTAVLVQRVIEKILKGGDISRLWIMTFTNAAAAEMRQKIENAIAEQLENEVENAHLQQQAILLGGAHISTVHAACKQLLEQNFHILGLDGSVTIGEESVLDIMFDKLLEDFAEQLYQRATEDQDIRELLFFFSGGRSDGKLLEVLRLAYRYYVEQPFPQTEFVSEEHLFDCFPFDALYQTIQDKLTEAAAQYELCLEQPKELLETKLWQSLQQEYQGIRLALEELKTRDFDALLQKVNEIPFASWSTRGKAYEPFIEQIEIAKGRRTYAKTLVTQLKQSVFNKTAAEHKADIVRTNRILTTLFTLIDELDREYAAQKKERNMISFSDLERYALSLLVERYDAQSDEMVPTPLAKELRKEIDEIIVDEYQDTNRKQDLIFRALSDEGRNVFMVGDVKQSIYRFRNACPSLFLEKKENSAPAENTHIDAPAYLYLNQNFRSHPDVLDFANQIFKSAMSTPLGQIEYDVSEQLHTGGLYPKDSRGHIELDIILAGEDAGEEDALTLIEQEASVVAQKIKALRGKPFYDVKQSTERPLDYGDMAILCRVTGGVTGHLETALRRQGISCINNNQDKQFLDVWEIKMLRSYLQVISNPYRDIPLITLMYSDFYCFTASELARIRAAQKYTSLYDAVRSAAESDSKCAAFLQEVEQLRRDSVGRRTDEVLQMIFARTHILQKIACYEDGKSRVANMRLMLRYAADYEKDSYKGSFSFLNYLEKMSALGKILPGARQGEAPENCVQLLSIHKSKGLEYPVCFVVNLGKAYRDLDVKTMITHDSLGVALKMRDDERFAEYTSLPFEMIKQANRRDELSEEMRILYVALTRPKTHLYLVSAKRKKDLEKLMQEVAAYQGLRPSEFLSEKPSALKWILYALRCQVCLAPLYKKLEIAAPIGFGAADCRFTTEIYEDITKKAYLQTASADFSVELGDALDLIRAQYPYESQTRLPLKLSVSEVKGLREKDPEAMYLIPQSFGRRKPQFLSQKLSGSAVGNAVHKFMQFAEFSALATENGIAKEKERLIEKAFMTEKELSLVPEEMIERFVMQPLFKDMISADRLEKEKRFFFSMPADRLYPETQETQPIMLQGVLDCMYEKNGELVIVDYKTDRLNDPAAFAERYALQLRLYRYAVKQLSGKKADKLYLYSFHLNEVIEIS